MPQSLDSLIRHFVEQTPDVLCHWVRIGVGRDAVERRYQEGLNAYQVATLIGDDFRTLVYELLVKYEHDGHIIFPKSVEDQLRE